MKQPEYKIGDRVSFLKGRFLLGGNIIDKKENFLGKKYLIAHTQDVYSSEGYILYSRRITKWIRESNLFQYITVDNSE